jgi:predicted nucleic acid-binding protein
MLYLDTSALLKLYLREPGSLSFRRAVDKHSPWLFTSRVAYAESLAGLARAAREHRIAARAYRQKRSRFDSDWRTLHIVELNEEVLAPCASLIERYRLRGLDAIHLCSAIWASGSVFGCFDEKLCHAASAEGLPLLEI